MASVMDGYAAYAAVEAAARQMDGMDKLVPKTPYVLREHAKMAGGGKVFPPVDSKDRINIPVTTGCFDYFPLALMEVARYSKFGNDKHNPGQHLHWAREKSTDHANNIGRHLIERGTIDPDSGFSHTAALAWRALALLQTELELKAGFDAAKEAAEAKDRGFVKQPGD